MWVYRRDLQHRMEIEHISPVHTLPGKSETVSKAAVVPSLTISYAVSPALLQRIKNCHKQAAACAKTKKKFISQCQFMSSLLVKKL